MSIPRIHRVRLCTACKVTCLRGNKGRKHRRRKRQKCHVEPPHRVWRELGGNISALWNFNEQKNPQRSYPEVWSWCSGFVWRTLSVNLHSFTQTWLPSPPPSLLSLSGFICNKHPYWQISFYIFSFEGCHSNQVGIKTADGLYSPWTWQTPTPCTWGLSIGWWINVNHAAASFEKSQLTLYTASGIFN